MKSKRSAHMAVEQGFRRKSWLYARGDLAYNGEHGESPVCEERDTGRCT